MAISDEESQLIARLLDRDPQAPQEFYAKYAPLLLRFIRRKVGNEQDVEEIAQDTLFAFLDHARDFTGTAKLSTYLCSIAAHKIVDFYRKKKLKRIVFSQLPEGFEQLFADLGSPEDALDTQFVRERISDIFARLKPQYAHVLQLKYIEGRDVKEIAAILKCSFKSAESILFRARRAFVALYVTSEM
ncbi:sigma-70 family RNA polymerase sigma factor [Candidatus Microgenomates bacterium]|nr:MAG: sigma-70 family RNA polymerase sigma factor [Candidatus Microgenomates bacterium]